MITRTHARRPEAELHRLVEAGAAELEGADPITVLRWAIRNLGHNFVVAASMADAVLVSLAAEAARQEDIPTQEIRVVFGQTGYHFAETNGTRDAVEMVYGVTVVDATPEQTVAQQDATYGKNLFATDPEKCCHLRKVIPMRQVLAAEDAWVTGIRKGDTAARRRAKVVSFDKGYGLIKLNPIVEWTDADKQRYIDEQGIIVNPLVDEGYPSIGCEPCTAKVLPGQDARSGRWAGRNKTECGLHVQ